MTDPTPTLADIQVSTPDGEAIRLGSLWADKPVVLLFMRHFGCLFCRGQVAHMKPHWPEIRALGAEAVVIGHGHPGFAKAFVEDFQPGCPVFVDRDRQAYAAAGMKRGLGTVLNPASAWNAARFLLQGHMQGATQGDPWQEGGVLIIAPPGKVIYSYISQAAGDHPPPEAIVDALRAPR